MRRIMGFIGVIGLWAALTAGAQAQFDDTLPPYTAVSSSIDTAEEREPWRFFALEGTMISLWARPEGGSLDPELTLTNSAGVVLLSNDDFKYPESTDAMLQGITLPRTDTYTVTVAGYDGSTGGYNLTLFYGYANLALANPYNGTAVWEEGGEAVVQEAAGIVAVSAAGVAVNGTAIDSTGESYADFYARLRVSVSGRNGWTAGMVLRANAERRYVVTINQRGQWRLVAYEGETPRVIRDWTNHPAIRAGEAEFTLAVLANGAGFDVFYNDAFVGQAVDTATGRGTTGRLGLFVETANAANSDTVAQFSELYVTVPRQINDADVLPSQLMAGSLGLTIQELERRRVIPVGGAQTLAVPESSGQQVNPGVNRVLLGRGVTYSTMVLSTTFTLESVSGAIVGCGLVFGSASDTQYSVAFLDGVGAYGLANRDGENFAPGLFGESQNPEWTQGRQHLLVVQLDDTAHFYVNRRHVGSLAIPASAGEVGNVVVNYEPTTAVCRFSDTWLWNLGG